MTTADGRIDRQVWQVVTVVVLGTLMAVLDTTIINIALASLTRELDTDLDTIQWVVTGYLLAIAAVVPMTGWAARRFTAKRVYIVSLAVFTIGSALCGLAQSVEQLVVFRVIQGLGGGAIMPVGQMLIVKVAGPKHLGRVMSVYGVPTVLAPVFGPTVGGLLLDTAGWSWIFYINVFVGIPAVIVGLRNLPTETRERVERVDLAGAGLSVAGLVALTYGLSQVGREFGGSGGELGRSILLSILGAVLLGLFVLRSLRARHPLLDMRLYANRAFSSAALTLFCLAAALIGTAILMPLYYQTVRGEGAWLTGLLVAPRGLGATAGTWTSGRLVGRLPPGRTATLGVTITLLLSTPFVLLSDHTPYALIGAVLFVQGFGIGLSMMPTTTAAFASLRQDQVSDASPQQQILMRIGGSLGTALLIVVLQHHLVQAGDSVARQADAFAVTSALLVGITAVAWLAVVRLLRVERRQSMGPASASTDTEALPLAGEAVSL